MFQLVGYPCCHAIAAIDYHRLKMEDFIDECFKKEVYLKVYSHMIHPVPGMHDFEDSKMGRVEPPDGTIKEVAPTPLTPIPNSIRIRTNRQGSSTSHGASGSRRYLQFFPNHLRIHSPKFQFSPYLPHDPPPQTAPRNPFKSSRTAPDETTTRGFNVHKPSYEQAVHSKKTTQQSVQQQHPQSSGVHQQQPKALRKQKKPISLSSKLLKRQQQDAPDQSSQFKREMLCREKSIYFFTDQRLSQLIQATTNQEKGWKCFRNIKST
ncbi:UNVERIFIED_CONTAM: hypothetical protein Scaly_0265200 [Sesamum calycinum]|uniref:SWIM-type domain-containing protein n=1 Tax=Sesamum calycinum TaxID=2727403 RepID=A0AAW2SBL0_9LAMI